MPLAVADRVETINNDTDVEDHADGRISRAALDAVLNDPKKQFPRFLFESDIQSTIELLSALVFHSDRGHSVAVECLWCWQDLMEEPYALSPVVEELRLAATDGVACAAFRLLVRLLRYSPDLPARIRIRNELDELGVDAIVQTIRSKFPASGELNELVSEWRKLIRELAEATTTIQTTTIVAKSSTSGDQPVPQQHQRQTTCTDADSGTFSGEEEEQTTTPAMTNTATTNNTDNISANASDQLEVDGDNLDPLATEFLRVLRSEKVRPWADESLRLLINFLESATILNGGESPLSTLLKRQNDDQMTAARKNNCNNTVIPPPPPPPPPPSLLQGTAPPPPPPPPSLLNHKNNLQSRSNNAVTPLKLPSTDIPPALRPKKVPTEGKKMRHLQWAKVPANLIATAQNGEDCGIAKSGASGCPKNVWQRMDEVDRLLKDRLDFTELDTFFSCSPTSKESPFHSSSSTNSNQVNGFGGHSSSASPSSKSAGVQQTVSLISGKRSLSVNIFLKMCRETDRLLATLAADVVSEDDCATEIGGLDRLKTLAQLLPTDEELQTLRHYTGDRTVLGSAEKFLIALIQIPDYKFKIDAMAFKLEFEVLISDIEPGLETIVRSCKELLSSRSLQKIFYVLLHMGNYLNHGASAGNAVGFKLNSLWKINEVKATRGGGGRTLLHILAQQTDNCSEELGSELANVQDASKLSPEMLRDDLKCLVDRATRLETAVHAKNSLFFAQFADFLKQCKHRLEKSRELARELEVQRREMAAFFCESDRSFSLEECFKIIAAFMSRYKIAVNENLQRQGQEDVQPTNGTNGNSQPKNLPENKTNKNNIANGTVEDSLTNFLLGDSSYGNPRRSRLSLQGASTNFQNLNGEGQTPLTTASAKRRTSMFTNVAVDSDRNRSAPIAVESSNNSGARRPISHSALPRQIDILEEQPDKDDTLATDMPKSTDKLKIIETTLQSSVAETKLNLESAVDKALKDSLPSTRSSQASRNGQMEPQIQSIAVQKMVTINHKTERQMESENKKTEGNQPRFNGEYSNGNVLKLKIGKSSEKEESKGSIPRIHELNSRATQQNQPKKVTAVTDLGRRMSRSIVANTRAIFTTGNNTKKSTPMTMTQQMTKVPLKTTPQPSNGYNSTEHSAPMASKMTAIARKNSLYRVRASKQQQNEGTLKPNNRPAVPVAEKQMEVPLRPSQIRAINKSTQIAKDPLDRGKLSSSGSKGSASSPSTTRKISDTSTSKTPFGNAATRSSSLLRNATQNNARINGTTPVLQRMPSTPNRCGPSKSMPGIGQQKNGVEKDKRQSPATVQRQDSVSTASRPTLIKTGSTASNSDKPKWI